MGSCVGKPAPTEINNQGIHKVHEEAKQIAQKSETHILKQETTAPIKPSVPSQINDEKLRQRPKDITISSTPQINKGEKQRSINASEADKDVQSIIVELITKSKKGLIKLKANPEEQLLNVVQEQQQLVSEQNVSKIHNDRLTFNFQVKAK